MKSRGKLDDTLAAMFSNPKYRSDYLFYAHIIGQCSIKIREDIPAPAGVMFKIDHYELIINPKLYDEYSLVERLVILKHEMLHILLNHVGRTDGRHHITWNFATDCALNQLCDKDHLPDDCILPESLGKMLKINVPDNKSAEFYYDLIKEAVEEQEQDGDQGQGGDSMDDHSSWEESTGDGDLQKDLTKKMIEKASEETIKGRGTVPSETSGWIELQSRKSQVNWKKVLRGITGNKRVGRRSTILRNDRRMPHRDDLRGKVKERSFNLLVVADVSGSMSDKALQETIPEVLQICKSTNSDVDLIQIDTVAYKPEKLTKNSNVFSRKGNGGTDLHPALEMAKTHNIDYQAVVVLTDGGLSLNDVSYFTKLNKKVIWLIESSGDVLDEMNSGRMKAFKLD